MNGQRICIVAANGEITARAVGVAIGELAFDMFATAPEPEQLNARIDALLPAAPREPRNRAERRALGRRS